MNVWEFHAQVSWVLEKSFLEIRRKSSKGFLDQEKLIKLILAWEKRISIDEFTHDAPDCPEVYLFAIVASHQELCRSVPPGSDVIGQSLLFVFNLSGETEVTYFEAIVLADKEVFGLDVPMDDVETVEVDKSLEKLVDEGADDGQFDAIGRFLQNF